MANIVSRSPYLSTKLQEGASASAVTYGVVDISATYAEAEVQAISTALTNLVATLKSQGIIK